MTKQHVSPLARTQAQNIPESPDPLGHHFLMTSCQPSRADPCVAIWHMWQICVDVKRRYPQLRGTSNKTCGIQKHRHGNVFNGNKDPRHTMHNHEPCQSMMSILLGYEWIIQASSFLHSFCFEDTSTCQSHSALWWLSLGSCRVNMSALQHTPNQPGCSLWLDD